MKLILPCPACHRSLLPPDRASAEARLKCPACSHELTAQSLVVESDGPTIGWQVVEDLGEGNVFSEVDPLEFSGISEDAVAFDGSNTADTGVDEEDMFGVSEDHWQSPAEGADPDDIFHRSPTDDPVEIVDGLAAVALAASGEPDTMEEMAGDEPEPISHLQIEVMDEEGFEPVADDFDEQAVFEEESFAPLELDDSHNESEDTLALIEEAESFEAIANETTNATAKDFEEVDELAFEDEFVENVDATTADNVEEKIAPTNPLPTRRSIAPEIILESPTPKARKKKSSFGMLLSIVGGGFASIPVSILLMWFAMGIDPFELGPTIASFAPWIVPSDFHGSQSTPTGQFPKIPKVRIEPMASNEPVVLPPTDDLNVEPPKSDGLVVIPPADGSIEPNMPSAASLSPDEILDSSIFAGKDRKPEISVDTSASVVMKPDESGVDLVPKLDPNAPDPSEMKKEPEGPKSPDEAFSALSVPKVMENETQDVALREALTKIEIAGTDLASEASVVELIDSINAFSTVFATIPPTEPRYAIWLNQCQRVLESISSKGFVDYSVAAFKKDPANSPALGWVGCDFVKVKLAEKQENGDLDVTSSNRLRKNLDTFPIIVPSSLALQADANESFWFIGILEESPTLGKPVFRVVLTKKKFH